MYVIFTDTDNDVTPEIANEYGFKLISMPYTIGDTDVHPYEDFDKFDEKSFYDMLRNGTTLKTTAVNSERYIEYFEPYFKEGKDILYIHFSDKFSSTFSFMQIAIDELKNKYPERKFYSVDTKGICALGLIMIRKAGEMYKAGKSAEEIVKWVEDNRDNYALYLYANDLEFFARSGRISNFSAIMGGLLGLHPVIHVNKEGKMVSLCKCRGKKNTLRKIVELVEESQENIADNHVIIAHSDAPEMAQLLGSMLEEKFGKLDIEYDIVNPTAGAHCGPGCMGVAFRSKYRKD